MKLPIGLKIFCDLCTSIIAPLLLWQVCQKYLVDFFNSLCPKVFQPLLCKLIGLAQILTIFRGHTGRQKKYSHQIRNGGTDTKFRQKLPGTTTIGPESDETSPSPWKTGAGSLSLCQRGEGSGPQL